MGPDRRPVRAQAAEGQQGDLPPGGLRRKVHGRLPQVCGGVLRRLLGWKFDRIHPFHLFLDRTVDFPQDSTFGLICASWSLFHTVKSAHKTAAKTCETDTLCLVKTRDL